MNNIRTEHLEFLELLEALEEKYRYNKIDTVFPETGEYRRELYPKQMEFMDAGAVHSERALVGGNRTGKTKTICTELTYHMMGIYPPKFKGRKFINPVSTCAVGVSSKSTRDILQF